MKELVDKNVKSMTILYVQEVIEKLEHNNADIGNLKRLRTSRCEKSTSEMKLRTD